MLMILRQSHATYRTILSGTKSTNHVHVIKGFNGRVNNDKNFSRKSLSSAKENDVVQRGFKVLLRPFCFTSLVVAGSFTGAIILQYEDMRHIYNYGRPIFSSQDSFFGKSGVLRCKVNTWWNGLQPGQKVISGIIVLNIGVFILWRIPALRLFMTKYFTCSPYSDATCWPLLLSAFSHTELLHLIVNMYVLWSFSSVAVQIFGKEQILATYISGAVISGFCSCVFKVARRKITPSLGASGAIMALLGIICTISPDSRLSIAFVDKLIPHSFSADTGMKCIIIFDTLGVLLGWRMFDHIAHLAGMFFGIWYIKYGHKLIWKKREKLVRIWHDIREKQSRR